MSEKHDVRWDSADHVIACALLEKRWYEAQAAQVVSRLGRTLGSTFSKYVSNSF